MVFAKTNLKKHRFSNGSCSCCCVRDQHMGQPPNIPEINGSVTWTHGAWFVLWVCWWKPTQPRLALLILVIAEPSWSSAGWDGAKNGEGRRPKQPGEPHLLQNLLWNPCWNVFVLCKQHHGIPSLLSLGDSRSNVLSL